MSPPRLPMPSKSFTGSSAALIDVSNATKDAVHAPSVRRLRVRLVTSALGESAAHRPEVRPRRPQLDRVVPTPPQTSSPSQSTTPAQPRPNLQFDIFPTVTFITALRRQVAILRAEGSPGHICRRRRLSGPSERRKPFGYKIIYHDLGEGSKRQRRIIGEELEPAKRGTGTGYGRRRPRGSGTSAARRERPQRRLRLQ
jgi:hypothetical protein